MHSPKAISDPGQAAECTGHRDVKSLAVEPAGVREPDRLPPAAPLPHSVPIGDPRLNTQSLELENLVCSTGEKENKAEGSGKKMLPAWSFPAALEGMRDVAWCGVATLLFPWVHGWLLVEGWGDRIEEQSGSWEFSCFEV